MRTARVLGGDNACVRRRSVRVSRDVIGVRVAAITLEAEGRVWVARRRRSRGYPK